MPAINRERFPLDQNPYYRLRPTGRFPQVWNSWGLKPYSSMGFSQLGQSLFHHLLQGRQPLSQIIAQVEAHHPPPVPFKGCHLT